MFNSELTIIIFYNCINCCKINFNLFYSILFDSVDSGGNTESGRYTTQMKKQFGLKWFYSIIHWVLKYPDFELNPERKNTHRGSILDTIYIFYNLNFALFKPPNFRLLEVLSICSDNFVFRPHESKFHDLCPSYYYKSVRNCIPSTRIRHINLSIDKKFYLKSKKKRFVLCNFYL